MAWDPDDTPWARQQVITNARGGGGLQCYFCGDNTAMMSIGDISEDTERLRIYCDNTACEAREVTVLVERDAARAAMRADVRALRALDDGDREVVRLAKAANDFPSPAEKLERRRSVRSFTLNVRGHDPS